MEWIPHLLPILVELWDMSSGAVREAQGRAEKGTSAVTCPEFLPSVCIANVFLLQNPTSEKNLNIHYIYKFLVLSILTILSKANFLLIMLEVL